ncbi:MAG: tetratricopeptide repeat protein [Candidatus Omnitrophica bacterium]|nr:tetratricopeptide repeat protein [Candidatus Omnitrophota bacterium]
MKLASLLIFFMCASMVTACCAQETVAHGLRLLTERRDKEALAVFEQVLVDQPHNEDALWGKAEILIRFRRFKEAEALCSGVLLQNPDHAPTLTSLAYLRYKDNALPEAKKLVLRALRVPTFSAQDRAMAYMMLGAINSKKSSSGGLVNKVFYGTQIKGYFQKAVDTAPDLAETHLGLGSFYLMAPAIVGGDIDKAISELMKAIELAPSYATAHVRLAQAYQKKGDQKQCNVSIAHAQALDPENEALQDFLRHEQSSH